MLWNLCVFALLATQALSSSRYFVGTFQGTYKWAYPIDICSLTGVALYGNAKYTCSDDGTIVTAKTYGIADTTCSTPLTSTNYTEDSELANGLYAFNCAGTDDYLKTKLLLGSCAGGTTATIYSAVNACFKVANTNTSADGYQQTQCNASTAAINIYGSVLPSCNAYSGYTKLQSTTYISTTCALYIQTSLAAVNAKLLDCVYDGNSNFPVTVNNSDDFTGDEDSYKQISVSIDAWATSESASDPMVCSLNWYEWLENYFEGSLVQVTTTCDSYEGEAYPSITVATTVTVYDSDFSQSCSTIQSNLKKEIEANTTNVNLTITCSQTDLTSAPTTTADYGSSLAINYFIVFVISCVVMTMYI